MRIFCRGRRNNGFTLIEVVLSITIFSVILTAVYVGFSSGFKVYEKASEDIRLLFEAARIANRLENELRNFCVFADEFDNFIGKGQAVSFICRKKFPADEGREAFKLNRVTYVTDKGGVFKLIQEKELSLTRKEEEKLRKKAVKLGKYLKGIYFSYGYGTGSKLHPVEWEDEWNNPLVAPRLIKVKFVFEKSGVDFVFERVIYINQGELGDEEFSLEQ